MQISQGSLVILDPHRTARVFWNGQEVPVTYVNVTHKFVLLGIKKDVVLPPGMETTPGIRVRRVK